VDELAEVLGMDPIGLRIRNEPEKDPISGLSFSSRHIVEAWRTGAERFGWNKRNPRPGTTRAGDWLVGMGCATATYPYYRMPGGAARLTLTRGGRATVDVAVHEMGMQQTAAIGASVIASYNKLVAELLRLAGNDSPLAGLKPGEVGSRDAGLCKLDQPERYESYASILGRAQRDEVSVEATPPNPLEAMHWSMHSHGAMFCEVRVNTITGEPRVSRFLGSFDCGRILNRKTAASQFRGGIIMGLGLALMEETQFDERNGRVMNPSLAGYHVPVHMDVPEIEVMWTDIPDPHTPMGARGIGEIGITGTGAAVANAVYNATGKRVRDLPITLDKLL
jgi:xanthine dehydrogenase YagR molybdenum-binding subunit